MDFDPLRDLNFKKLSKINFLETIRQDTKAR